ncbi:hypothetical protein GTQ38_06490 [Flavobacteriaceae bacterium R33]|uniref:DUF2268 domain-containing protein n=2 Tax=Poritiphilus flavus TaxID=2697053 RepID=A0A6L9EAN0_9FLAO|nr:hypothetical protein [Poritiphilus flavus]
MIVKTLSRYLTLVLLAGFLLNLVSCREDKKMAKGVEALYLPNMDRVFENYDLLDSTKNYSDFAEQLVEANRDLRSSEMYVQAAMLYHQAGKSDEVAPLLNLAIDQGMANPKLLSKFPNLKPSENSESWKRLKIRLDSLQQEVQELSHFDLEMESMNRFWDYFEIAVADSAKAKTAFKEFIFDGPKELRDFYVVRYSSIDNMYGQMINAAPGYYRYLKHQFSPDSMNALKAQTKKWMSRFKQLYPQAVFPKVYVVPGILNSGGTATEMGLFIGGDMYGRSDNMPTEGLNDWQKGAIMKFSELPGLTIHELMHFQQSYRDTLNTNNVLRGVIEEGVCDFLLELSSQKPLKNKNLSYLEKPGKLENIMNDLKQDLYTNDLSRWLYNGGAIEDRPHDLGYTVGYLITKSYYNLQPDKKAAIYELLNTDDFTMIVEESEYAYLLNQESN